MVDDHGAEALSRRIVELEKQVAGILACQAHARLVEEERDVLRAKLASEEHSTDGLLVQRIIELEAQVASIPACQAHARQVAEGHDAIIKRLVSEAHATDAQLDNLRRLNDGLVSQARSSEQARLDASRAQEAAEAGVAVMRQALSEVRLESEKLSERLPNEAELQAQHLKALAAQRAVAS